MKKRFLGLLLSVMLISVCVGCGAESTTTEPTETATETTTEESTTEQAEEATATPEETAEPTPETKEETSEETTAETEPETTEIAEPEQAETPTTEPVTQYTYTDMSATMFAQQTVNVRDLPDTSGNKLGSLSTNDEITISAKCNETGWYMFEYNGSVAYVSNKYVGENKVEVQAPANNNSGTGSTASGQKNWQDYYADHTWYDMNEFMFIIVDSRDEGCSGIDYSGAEATLQERFPGEKVFLRYGSELRDGHWMYFAYVRPETNGVSAFNKQFK